MLTSITTAKRVLELGTFTGYSTLCLAEGLYTHDKTATASKPVVVTCDPDSKALSIACKYFDLSNYGDKVQFHEMKANDLLDKLRNDSCELFDVVFIDADKKNYIKYIQELLGDAIKLRSSDNSSDNNNSKPPMLRDEGLILVDNVLWKVF